MQIRIECDLEIPDQSATTAGSIQARIAEFSDYLTKGCGLQPHYAAALLDTMAEGLRATSETPFVFSLPDLGDEDDDQDVFDRAETEIKQLEQSKALAKLQKQYERADRLERGIEMLGLAAEMLLLVPQYFKNAREIASKYSAAFPISFGRGYFLSDDIGEFDDTATRQIHVPDPFGPWRENVFVKFGFTDGFRAKAAAIKLVHSVVDQEIFDRALEEDIEGAEFYAEMLSAISSMGQFTSKELAVEIGCGTIQVSSKLPMLASLGIIERLSQSKGLVQYIVIPEIALQIEEAKARARKTLEPLLTTV